jgi:hypothetical protein
MAAAGAEGVDGVAICVAGAVDCAGCMVVERFFFFWFFWALGDAVFFTKKGK